ncbi:hypothetical protein I4F81_007312 [Pyropia yezoensis]|uniref:Uncharacterized protein n=1 Tax=Pyropia yezoensis TaxID=2788 RepID=A0ACC3C377_PYRYE|nr:hypothetical protein I4F81_007312 [Neopyropia yezoensis]
MEGPRLRLRRSRWPTRCCLIRHRWRHRLCSRRPRRRAACHRQRQQRRRGRRVQRGHLERHGRWHRRRHRQQRRGASAGGGGPPEGTSGAVGWEAMARSVVAEMDAHRPHAGGASTRSGAGGGADGGANRSGSAVAAATAAAAAGGPSGPGSASGSLPGDGTGALVSSLRAMRRRRSSGSLPAASVFGVGDPAATAAAMAAAGPSPASTASVVMAERRAALAADEGLLVPLGTALFECLMQFFVASSSATARRLALTTLEKFVILASPSLLRTLALGGPDGPAPPSPSRVVAARAAAGPTAQLGPFVALLLRDSSLSSEVATGLSLARSALAKVPAMKTPFVREGVIHELRRLAASTSTARAPASGSSTAANRLADREAALRSLPMSYRPSMAGAAYTAALAAAAGPPLSETAQAVLDTYFPSSKAGRGKATKSQKGKAVAATKSGDGAAEDGLEFSVLTAVTGLRQSLAALQPHDVGVKPMVRLARLLSSNDGITTFELSRSGLVPSLVDYLESRSLPDVRARRTVALVSALGRAGASSFSTLVSGTLGVLAAEDTLPLLVHDSSSGGSSSTGGAISASSAVGNSLRQLTQPFKLRLRRAASSTSLRDYSHHVVLIEPLATMSSVQEFLWRRVRPASAGSGPIDDGFAMGAGDSGDVDDDHDEEHDDDGDEDEEGLHGHGLGDPLDDADGHYDDGEDDGADESAGPDDDDGAEERGMFEMEEDDEDNSRLRRELGLDEDAMDEDDEGDEIDDEMDDGGAAGAFGSADGLGTSLPPVELDLDALRRGGDPSPGGAGGGGGAGVDGGPESDSGAAASRSASFTRSYAAAVSRGARGRRGSFDPSAGGARDVDGRALEATAGPPLRLQFNLNGVDIPQDSSILQAVLRSSSGAIGGGGSGTNSGRRLWDNIHTLEYSAAAGTAAATTAAAAASPAATTSPAKRAAAASAGLSSGGSGDQFGERPEGRGGRLTRSQKKQRGDEHAATGGGGGGSSAGPTVDGASAAADASGAVGASAPSGEASRDSAGAVDGGGGTNSEATVAASAPREGGSLPVVSSDADTAATVIAGAPVQLDFEVPEQVVSPGLPPSTAAAVKLLLYLRWVDTNLRARPNGPPTLSTQGLSDFVAANTSTPAAVAVTDDEVDEVDDRTAAATVLMLLSRRPLPWRPPSWHRHVRGGRCRCCPLLRG